MQAESNAQLLSLTFGPARRGYWLLFDYFSYHLTSFDCCYLGRAYICTTKPLVK